MNTNTKKVAIIGCNGYIGKHLCAFLLEKKWIIFGYDKGENSLLPIHNYIPLNLLDKDQVDKIDTNVDFIFYFSGITGTSKGYDDYELYIDVNEKGLLHLLNRMYLNRSTARLIFPSTRLVYKGEKGMPLKEEAEKEFKTIYALNKWFGEQVIQQYSKYFDLKYNIFRICVPYGNLFPNDYSYGTVGFFLRKAKEKENITLFGTGEQKRTFTHIEDICIQIYNTILFHSSENQIFNIGGETYSLNEVALQIANRFNIKVENSEWPEIDKKLESGDTIFEYAKIQEFSKKPLKQSFESWLKEIV